VLALGDKVALGLGVNLVQTRLLGLLAIALLCGAAVAVAGPIGFVGLVVPHVVRRLVTEDIRLALPLAAPVGRWCWCWRISPPGRWSRRRSWRPGR
jgi:iron complex transport system permease protein